MEFVKLNESNWSIWKIMIEVVFEKAQGAVRLKGLLHPRCKAQGLGAWVRGCEEDRCPKKKETLWICWQRLFLRKRLFCKENYMLIKDLDRVVGEQCMCAEAWLMDGDYLFEGWGFPFKQKIVEFVTLGLFITCALLVRLCDFGEVKSPYGFLSYVFWLVTYKAFGSWFFWYNGLYLPSSYLRGWKGVIRIVKGLEKSRMRREVGEKSVNLRAWFNPSIIK